MNCLYEFVSLIVDRFGDEGYAIRGAQAIALWSRKLLVSNKPVDFAIFGVDDPRSFFANNSHFFGVNGFVFDTEAHTVKLIGADGAVGAVVAYLLFPKAYRVQAKRDALIANQTVELESEFGRFRVFTPDHLLADYCAYASRAKQSDQDCIAQLLALRNHPMVRAMVAPPPPVPLYAPPCARRLFDDEEDDEVMVDHDHMVDVMAA